MENKTNINIMKHISPIPTIQFPNIRIEVGIPVKEELICLIVNITIGQRMITNHSPEVLHILWQEKRW